MKLIPKMTNKKKLFQKKINKKFTFFFLFILCFSLFNQNIFAQGNGNRDGTIKENVGENGKPYNDTFHPNRQFLTVQTEDGSEYFLIIDYLKDDKQVKLLKQVADSDFEETSSRITKAKAEEEKEKALEEERKKQEEIRKNNEIEAQNNQAEENTKKEAPVKFNSDIIIIGGAVIFVFIFAVGKKLKKKKQVADAAIEDKFQEDEDGEYLEDSEFDEEYMNEDSDDEFDDDFYDEGEINDENYKNDDENFHNEIIEDEEERKKQEEIRKNNEIEEEKIRRENEILETEIEELENLEQVLKLREQEEFKRNESLKQKKAELIKAIEERKRKIKNKN